METQGLIVTEYPDGTLFRAQDMHDVPLHQRVDVVVRDGIQTHHYCAMHVAHTFAGTITQTRRWRFELYRPDGVLVSTLATGDELLFEFAFENAYIDAGRRFGLSQCSVFVCEQIALAQRHGDKDARDQSVLKIALYPVARGEALI